MEVVRWPLSCGIKELDQQHQEITELFSEIRELPSTEQLVTIFRSLVYHFLLEESVLWSIIQNLSTVESHIFFHLWILTNLDQLIRRPWLHEEYTYNYSKLLVWINQNDHWDDKYLEKIRWNTSVLETIRIETQKNVERLVLPAQQIRTEELLSFYEEMQKNVNPRDSFRKV
jgi:hemerythrin